MRDFQAGKSPVLKRKHLRLKRSNATMKLQVLLLQRPDVAPFICEFLAELIVWCMWHRTVASNVSAHRWRPSGSVQVVN
jgi:hypothetical protein